MKSPTSNGGAAPKHDTPVSDRASGYGATTTLPSNLLPSEHDDNA